jgi:hypothetical protein
MLDSPFRQLTPVKAECLFAIEVVAMGVLLVFF